jgi:hypothetical protein
MPSLVHHPLQYLNFLQIMNLYKERKLKVIVFNLNSKLHHVRVSGRNK